MKIGTKVWMGERNAEWCLNHPEIYTNVNGVIDECYDSETQLHLMCCLGQKVPGKIVGHGAEGFYHVEYSLDGLKADYYLSERDFELR